MYVQVSSNIYSYCPKKAASLDLVIAATGRLSASAGNTEQTLAAASFLLARRIVCDCIGGSGRSRGHAVHHARKQRLALGNAGAAHTGHGGMLRSHPTVDAGQQSALLIATGSADLRPRRRACHAGRAADRDLPDAPRTQLRGG